MDVISLKLPQGDQMHTNCDMLRFLMTLVHTRECNEYDINAQNLGKLPPR